MKLEAIALLVVALAACGRTTPLFPRTGTPAPDSGHSPGADAGLPPADAGPPPVDAGPPPPADAGGRCEIVALPTAVDFGSVPLGSAAEHTVVFTNTGSELCDLSDLAVDADPDAGFSLNPDQPTAFALGAGGSTAVTVDFETNDPSVPRNHSGNLVVNTSGSPESLSVPLSAVVTVGCLLQVSPTTLDEGNVPLNTSVVGSVILTNTGDATCDISQVALDPVGSPLFTLPAAQPRTFELAPGDTTRIAVDFDADDSTQPHLRTGTLEFLVEQPSGLPAMPPTMRQVPLEAFINTACLAGSQWIYTVDSDGTLSTFDPQDLTFTDLGQLSCPDTGTPFSMAVDQSAIAWVEYTTGNIYRVDPATLACTATQFQVNPQLTNFGMGFVFDPATGTDTLYVAGSAADVSNPTSTRLGTISFPSLALTPGPPITFGAPELTGTGDGQLWGFAPASATAAGVTTLAQIDPATGDVLTEFTYPQVTTSGSWAVKFWGGSLWLFLGDTIYQVDRTTGQLSVALSNTGHDVVGAGVSTCAPVQ